MLENLRPLEEAADELGRLESVTANAPEAVATALRISSIAQLAGLDSDANAPDSGTAWFASLAAADADARHDAELPPSALYWRTLIETEERRVRGGAPLASQRFAIVAPALATYSDRARLEAIWRESGVARPVLIRALDAAAWSPTTALGEAGAALMLCAGGRTDRVRLLPFVDADQPQAPAPASTRESAIAAWRAGDTAPWARFGLDTLARRARVTRLALERVLRSRGEEDARLDPLGRAAINARRALALLRDRFVVTMPSLAAELSLSRPAASDALERLVATGTAREMTGRARDRVYGWSALCPVATAAAGVATDAPTGS